VALKEGVARWWELGDGKGMLPGASDNGTGVGIEGRGSAEFFDCVYEDLRRIARRMIAGDGGLRTLQATALVHEAFLRFNRSTPQSWDHRGHFVSAAVESMRRVLIDHARRKCSQRGGGGRALVSLDTVQVAGGARSELLLALDEALERLAVEDPVKAEVVKLRYFGGCSIAEVASVMGLAERTVKWHWTYARAWLADAVMSG
jgi:RNA polymerase sigma factor (TIGR02999 family)